MSALDIDLTRSADLIVRRLLSVRAGEVVAIVCDPHTEMRMAHALAGVVESVGGEYTVLTMPTRDISRKNELTAIVEAGIEAAQCLIGLTGASGAPTYARRVKELYDARKLRGMSMVMRDAEVFTLGGARADYDALHAEGLRLAELWEGASEIHVTSPAGTDLRAPIKGEQVIVECGFATEPGQEAAFSDGEVSQMPREGQASGTVVIDGPIAHIGAPTGPITLRIETGRIAAVEGEATQAAALRDVVTSVAQADNVAEIGIGLNPMSRRNGHFQEEKKARGNVHVALGDNIFYGGTIECAVHMDMVLYRPTVEFDGQVVVADGQVRIP